jgi:death-on-curing family protein
MTNKLLQTPLIWLDLKSCRIIYDHFSTGVSFSQPLSPFSDKYEGRLESVLGSVQASFDGKLFYPEIGDVAAVYLVKLNIRHPFVNGNKRLSVLFTDIFLLMNDIDLRIPYTDMFNLAAEIAKRYELGSKEDDLIEVSKKIIHDFSHELNGKE